MRLIFVIGIAILLAACQTVQNRKEMAAAACKTDLSSAAVQRISNRVEIAKSTSATPPAYLSDRRLPTAAEHSDLESWRQALSDCYSQLEAADPSNTREAIFLQDDLELVDDLQAQSLTYGQFAQMRRQLYRLHEANVQSDTLAAWPGQASLQEGMFKIARELAAQRLEQESPHHYVFMNRHVVCVPHGELLNCTFEQAQ